MGGRKGGRERGGESQMRAYLRVWLFMMNNVNLWGFGG